MSSTLSDITGRAMTGYGMVQLFFGPGFGGDAEPGAA